MLVEFQEIKTDTVTSQSIEEALLSLSPKHLESKPPPRKHKCFSLRWFETTVLVGLISCFLLCFLEGVSYVIFFAICVFVFLCIACTKILAIQAQAALDEFEKLVQICLTIVQDTELVSMGYRISVPSPPILRLEQRKNSSLWTLSSLRMYLLSSLIRALLALYPLLGNSEDVVLHFPVIVRARKSLDEDENPSIALLKEVRGAVAACRSESDAFFMSSVNVFAVPTLARVTIYWFLHGFNLLQLLVSIFRQCHLLRRAINCISETDHHPQPRKEARVPTPPLVTAINGLRLEVRFTSFVSQLANSYT